ncbi:beta-ketoacyl-ACP synthase III [Candidatus Gromoviella agglomerans]|uniref:beta-ketoacyl-ACP synthase III n=1 Tax=Candidatus Gromoviella agglomerans TaxID=2806609 RepID=UPI001E356C7F|nr:beta-ketoacyl-ACP synthase III [Candidatus Gromoviella agglomerans]UFX98601.1 Beta-ketoacyl-ACP synthase 3 [Candidatus Gromoviella agglomerans]
MSVLRSKIIACGGYLPQNVVTNKDLESVFDTTHDWIVERTGILQRCVADEFEYTSHLAVHAAKNAIQMACIDPMSIDMILLATSTPDHTFPATSSIVQAAIGANNAYAFDLQAVCSGFIFALTTADMYIRHGMASTVVVIGAETFSRILNPLDRSTAVLFSDGAGAMILQASEEMSGGHIIESVLHTDGKWYDALKTSGGPSTTGYSGYVEMNGRLVFRHAVEKLSSVIVEILEKSSTHINEIDWFIPHQANKRIINAVANNVNIDQSKIIYTGDMHANTSAASVPLAFDQAFRQGKVKKGDIVLFESFGAGFSWGAILAKI